KVGDNNAETWNQIAVSGPATHFALSTPSLAFAGVAFNVTVSAADALGNLAGTYTGTVTLTNTSPTGTITVLGSYTFTAADQGVHVFSVTLTPAGTQTLTATDANGLLGTYGFEVYAVVASQFVFTAYPSSVSA